MQAQPDWAQLSGWAVAQRGLALYHRALVAAVVLFVGALVVTVLGLLTGLVPLLLVVQFVAGLGMLVIQSVMIVALARFARQPPVAGAVGLARGALALSVAALVTAVGAGLARQVDRELAETVALINRLAMLGGFLALLLALRRVARFIGRADIASAAGAVLGLMAAVVALQLAAGLFGVQLFALLGGAAPVLVLLVQVVLLLVGLVLFVSAAKDLGAALQTATITQVDVFD